ncbi:MFS transporter [Streptosporangium saharense]|uniref:DHA2 family methylenomycin A resistance protein-like MFS transporter n=1 Tax=Streptosporangium saharense TaxID=1706840 RepID=A0A7W7VSC6_9ACTN|nr:MFS transporter [Streptosporangium saharense]MBB4920623.1 DHA2 family methylenomycin A resistance protein-like MFS transporter [Streptosporangium saharense]
MSLPKPLVALSLGYFLVMLDVTVVNVAVPAIGESVHTDASALAWVVDGYSTVFAGLLLLGGGLGDRLGHRGVLLTGLGVFTVASLGCGFATAPLPLVAARMLQGVGGALLVPTSLALLAAAHPSRTARARAIGVWGGVAGVAFAAGPLVGGLLVAGLSWRAAFWINVPVALMAGWLTLRHVPATHTVRCGLDPVGQVLGVVGLTALAATLNEAGTRGWTSPPVLTALGVGVVALGLFVLVERRPGALLPPSLFRSPGFSQAAAIGVLLNLGYYGMLYLATLYFQNERGYGALGTGIALVPTVCTAVFAAPLSGRLTARYGPRLPMAGALLLGAAGFLGWLLAGPGTPYWQLLPALVITGLATPATVPAATAAIVQAVPDDSAGVASAVFNVARQIGNAVGVALFSTVPGLHPAALIASGAFLTGALLALTSATTTSPRALIA